MFYQRRSEITDAHRGILRVAILMCPKLSSWLLLPPTPPVFPLFPFPMNITIHWLVPPTSLHVTSTVQSVTKLNQFPSWHSYKQHHPLHLPCPYPCQVRHLQQQSWLQLLFAQVLDCYFGYWCLFLIYLFGCGVQYVWPRIEPVSSVLDAWSLNHWITREVPGVC